MSTFDLAIPTLLNHESGNLVPDDNGRGPSRWGVTLETYKQYNLNATPADIDNLSKEEATAFYRFAFWERLKIGLIDDQDIATKVLDQSAPIDDEIIRILQKAVGVIVDGILGPITASRVNSSSPQSVIAGIKIVGKQYYTDLVTKYPNLAKDYDGWISRLNS